MILIPPGRGELPPVEVGAYERGVPLSETGEVREG